MGRGQYRLGRLRALGRARDCLVGVGIAGVAVSAIALASAFGGALAGSSDSASPGTRITSAFATIHAQIGDDRASPGLQISNVRLASLHTQVTAATALTGNEGQTAASRPATDRASFDERFNSLHGERLASFDQRFAAAQAGARDRAPSSLQRSDWLAAAEYRLETAIQEKARVAMRGPAADTPAKTQAQAPAGATPGKPLRLAYAPSDLKLNDIAPRDVAPSDGLPADVGKRTAIYDISARVLYMPNGERLEAHSGLGEHMDDLRSVRIRNKGVTPTNVYKLSLREKLFHGVRAVRMTPVAPHKMYGRDGFLVHSYLLGPQGESNGCVSVNDYPKFLNAFLSGEVDRLVVVERLAEPPAEPGANWLAERIRTLFEQRREPQGQDDSLAG